MIKTEPLRGNIIDVKINGQKVATMEGNEVYSGVFSPGWVLITVPGGEAKINAEVNKEYVFEIAFVGSTGGAALGFLFFGIGGALAGSSIDAIYTISLKETLEIDALRSATVTEPRVFPPQTSDESGQPTQQPTEEAKAATAAQSQPAPVEAAVKSAPLAPAVAPAVPAAASAAQTQPTKPPGVGSATALRLRELNELRKEGLITEREYDEKRKAILSAM